LLCEIGDCHRGDAEDPGLLVWAVFLLSLFI